MDSHQTQQTLKNTITIKGVGLHTGRKCKAIFKPAPENYGIRFHRTDVPGSEPLKAKLSNVIDIIRGTTIGTETYKIYTIEHILSALTGLGVDNVLVEIDDNEPPVADGSSKIFAEAIEKTGLVSQSAERSYFEIQEKYEYQSNQTILRIEPSSQFEVECEIEYNHPLIKNQSYKFILDGNYAAEIAPARTFCFDYEIETLKRKGLAKGGSLDNAIVIGPTGIYNSDSELRFPNEFVRHKILDLMGDLTLVGKPMKGKIYAKRCGHGHNIKFLKGLLERESTPSSAPSH